MALGSTPHPFVARSFFYGHVALPKYGLTVGL